MPLRTCPRNMPSHTVGGALAFAMLMLTPVPGSADESRAPVAVGANANVGCGENPMRAERLIITKPGVYENYLIDGGWVKRNLVKIEADDVTLRDCEIRNGRHNAVAVYAKRTVIESCRIHHMLAGSFANQRDAHGITGRPTNLVIRNCEIFYVSGDAVQFDPGRGPWDNVLIENCTFWTGQLPDDVARFHQGERPGENAVDTKQRSSNARSELVIRDCLFYGWNQPAQIHNAAALNLKDHVDVTVTRCLFRDNEICFRLRGGTGSRGGARVTNEDCAVYRSRVGLRIEDGIRDLKIRRLGIGDGVARKIRTAGGGAGSGYQYVGEYRAPPLEKLRQDGAATPPDQEVEERSRDDGEVANKGKEKPP